MLSLQLKKIPNFFSCVCMWMGKSAVYVCVCVHMHVYVCVCTCMCMCMCVYAMWYVYVCVYACVCVCVYHNMMYVLRVIVHKYMYLCYVYINGYMYVCGSGISAVYVCVFIVYEGPPPPLKCDRTPAHYAADRTTDESALREKLRCQVALRVSVKIKQTLQVMRT